METNYIRWNLPNWITIFLMGAVGYLLIGAVTSAIRGNIGTNPFKSGG